MFSNSRVGAPSMDQLTSWCVNESSARKAAGPKLHLLPESANIGRLMALDTPNVVVGRTESIIDRFAFGKNESILFERTVATLSRRVRFFCTLVYQLASLSIIVKEVVSIRIHVGRRGFGCGFTLHGSWQCNWQRQRRHKQE